ncbi:ATP-binding protein [Deinococcus aquaticus]|uniref:ATP-binding protein n=1 Tax=Deinococcus aquaticus TaxID=328692 RepID=UPI0036178D00
MEREARTLGLHLDAVQVAPPAPFAGRETELAALGALMPGQVAWITGHAGMGKTALLDALARAGGWTVLPGRADLPFGTLAPLSAAPPTSTHAALNALRDPQVRVAVDGWEGTDPGTQATLTLAAQGRDAQVRPGAALLITGRTHPPFDVDLHLHLGPLEPGDLTPGRACTPTPTGTPPWSAQPCAASPWTCNSGRASALTRTRSATRS